MELVGIVEARTIGVPNVPTENKEDEDEDVMLKDVERMDEECLVRRL